MPAGPEGRGKWRLDEGSVVKMRQSVPARRVVAGNPAEVVRELTEEDRTLWTFGKQLYVDLAKKYLDVGMQPITPRQPDRGSP